MIEPLTPAHRALGKITVTLFSGSLLEPAADALVNPSNTRLWLGSGVSGVLRDACGPELQEAMSRVGGIDARGVAVTPAFRHTKVREIIHVPSAKADDDLIEAAYANVIRRALEAGHRRVLLPALGAGVGGMAFEDTAEALRNAIEDADAGAELELVVALVDAAARDAFGRVFDL